MNATPKIADVDKEIARQMDSIATSFWFKDALQAALKRDPVDAANDADRLAALLHRRAAALLGPTGGGEVVRALEELQMALRRHSQQGGAHPFDMEARAGDADAQAVFRFVMEMFQESRLLHPDGGSPGTDFLLARDVLMGAWQGYEVEPLRDAIARADNPAFLVHDDRMHGVLEQASRQAPFDADLLAWRDGVQDLAVGLRTWKGAQDAVQLAGAEPGRWHFRPSRRRLPSVSVLTTERTAAQIGERVAETMPGQRWSWSARFAPRSAWRDGEAGLVPVWTLTRSADDADWRCRKKAFAAEVAADLQTLATAFGRYE